MNKAIVLRERPVGKPTLDNFEIIEEEKPSIEEGEMLLKAAYVSVDPYLRGRMTDAKSYVPPFKLGEPLQSALVAEVIESLHPDFKPGDYVTGNLDWKEYQAASRKGLSKIENENVSLSAYLGILGMTGLTAYLGLTEIGSPQQGDTIVVSGAAGAVGSIVGQIGKIMDCRVIGLAGTDEKVNLLKDKFGFDEAINYKTTKNMKEAIAKAAPDGVDVYFDNVGGDISDAIMVNVNQFGRVVVCGAISLYNETESPTGPRVQPLLVKNRILMQGFIVSDYASKFPEAIKQLSQWLEEGKLTYSETVVEGFEQIPQAFIDLFEGKNTGKMVVKV
jgi:NADPH-dependent curcumin reductase CurA